MINVGRGAVVDEAAMIEALRSRHLKGAALDVFATEPLPPDHPLWTLDNVFITPHMGGRSDRYVAGFLPVLAPTRGARIDSTRGSRRR